MTALTLATAVGCAPAAGALFAFSAFVTDAPARLEPAHGVLAGVAAAALPAAAAV